MGTTYINAPGDTLGQHGITIHHLIFAFIACSIIFSTTSFTGVRWSRPLSQALKGKMPMDGNEDISKEKLRRKALHYTTMMAGTSVLGWIMAGLLFGMILSQTTHDLITGAYQMEPLSPMKVKGKSQEVMLYKLLGTDCSP